MRKLILTAALLAFTGGAYAADMPYKAPPAPPPAPSWTGWYIGINGGGGWGTVDPGAKDAGPDGFFALANVGAVQAGAGQHFTTSGGLAGGQIGYLYQAGPLVTGVEAAFDWADINGSTTTGPTVYPVTPPSTFTWHLNSSTDFLATFMGRIGVDVGGWYPYITGGAALAHLKYSANFVDTFYPTNNTFNFSRNSLGWALGAGAEGRLWDHWMLRGEVIHMEFASVNGVGTIACNNPGVPNCAAGGNTTNFIFNARVREDIARLMLSYKF
jgi:outer membrane immunogenic protein